MENNSDFMTMAREAVYRYAAEAKYVPRYWLKRRYLHLYENWRTLLFRLNDSRIEFWNLLFPVKDPSTLINESQVLSRLPHFEFLWNHLEGDEEREQLLKIFTLRMLFLGKLVAPIDQFDWTRIQPSPALLYTPFPSLKNMRTKYPSKFPVNAAQLFAGAPDITINSSMDCLIDLFLFGQYQHPLVRPSVGDYCIDCGAFMGETSIWMAAVAGEQGRCYSVEMMPENVEYIHENMRLNPEAAKQVEVIQTPLGSIDGIKVGVTGTGGASQLLFGDKAVNSDRMFETMTLDTMVRKHNISKVDFVKMDVEGAELDILKGGAEMLRMFRPKLAVSVYHDDRDFDRIPRFIDSLELGYKFYIGHHHLGWNETVLYALAKAES